MEKGTLIASFRKNALEEVRAQIVNYKGYELADIRVWVEAKDGSGMLATKKGLTINIELIPELKKMILSLTKAIGGKDEK
jgi:hypothetical protein